MEVFVSTYQLFLKGNTQREARQGALLKVLQTHGGFGYADCHPWVEFGDAPLDSQLTMLKEGKPSALMRQSLIFAGIDAEARAAKKNLFQGVESPQNHHHFFDNSLISEKALKKLAKEEIRFIKVKAGLNFQKDCELIVQFSKTLRSNHLKLRLDFNSRLDEKQFSSLLKQCAQHLDVIDFFEDPFTYDPVRWQEMREAHKIKLACDRDSLRALSSPFSCDFLVVKPAIQDIAPFLEEDLKDRLLVLTSYLDHPIGQLSSLFVAAKIKKEKPEILSECGFLSHHAYVLNQFSHLFKQKGSRLIPSMEGYGWGYDDFLEALNWITLS